MVLGVWLNKVLRDLLKNKSRSVLVVLSIAVGVFAIGLVVESYEIMSRDLKYAYNSVNPAMAAIYSEPFQQEFLESIRSIKGVTRAEGRQIVTVRVKVGTNEWRPLQLNVIPDYKRISINKIKALSGAWPPPEKQMLIERSGLDTIKAGIGDMVEVECPDRKKRFLRIAGVVHDITKDPTFFSGRIYGYITLDTLDLLGLERALNIVDITVEGNPPSQAYIRQEAQKAWNKIENSGLKVFWLSKDRVGEHPEQSMLDALLLSLGFIGILSLIASVFLLINTISSLLTQEVRQIGVMKAIGASSKQIVVIYMSYVILYSILALIIAIPLANWTAGVVSKFIASYMNFDIIGKKFSYSALLAEVVAGLVVPVFAGGYPIINGVRITVSDAINSYGLNSKSKLGRGTITGKLNAISSMISLAVSNVFRRKSRLILTLITLTISGVIFISIFNIRASMIQSLEDALNYLRYDARIDFRKSYRIDHLTEEALNVPGVSKVETWLYVDHGRLLKSEERESESTEFQMVALPQGSSMINPTVLQGRWLVPEDEIGVVINTNVLKDNPSIKIGDQLIIKLSMYEKRKTYWTVVGIVKGITADSLIYTNYSYFSHIIGKPGQCGTLVSVFESRDPVRQKELAKAMSKHFQDIGLQINNVEVMSEIKSQIQSKFNVVIMFLLAMALLLAFVGGLGLMGTMGINVIERTREIGILRSIGASNWVVMRLFITEGVVIGILSWLVSLIIVLPISKIFSDMVGNAFFDVPFSFTFSFGGAILWLVLVIILSAVSCILPAWNASRLCIRDLLAYE